MQYILGIDGGGTGCRGILADRTGQILARSEGGSANVNSDLDGTLASILALCDRLTADHDIALNEISAVLGLAGANVSAKAAALAQRLPFGRAQIVSDGQTAARGALGVNDGIMAAIGTGSAFAVQKGNEFRQTGGRGFVLGDEGSGAVIGRMLLADALRADDGLIEMTPVLGQILTEFGSAEAVITFGFTASPGAFGRYARLALSTPEDLAVERVMSATTADVAGIIDTLQRQSGHDLPVVFTGGLAQIYAARLAHRYQCHAPQGSSVEGALAMAQEVFA